MNIHTDRVFNRYLARVYLTQARIFKARGTDEFWRTLLAWARHVRTQQPAQRRMF